MTAYEPWREAREMSGSGSAERVCATCKVTLLSRYNPDPSCSACQRAIRETSVIVPPWLWDSEPMRQAWARLDPAAAVTMLRAAARLSQEELGCLVDGWSQSMVSLIERGLRDTLFDIRKLLAFADSVGMPREALLPLILGRADATLGADHKVAPPGDDVDRRDFNGMAAGLLAASSGNIELQTRVWVNLSMQNTYLANREDDKGLAREGLRLAKLAAGVARHEPSPRLHALIALREGAAHARLGDAGAFRTAITQARRELDHGPHPADPPWCGFVIEPEITGHEAGGQMRLGFAHQSIKLYESVLDADRLTPRNRICWEASFAGALLDAGDRAQTLARSRAIVPALTAGQVISSRPLARLRGVRVAAEEVGDEEFCVLYDTATRSLAS